MKEKANMKIINFLNSFLGFFKVLNENSQLNIIKSINKDHDRKILLEIGPINHENSANISPYSLLKNKVFIKQFNSSDIKLIKAILIADGDVFITAKNYEKNEEIFTLESALDGKIWKITKEGIKINKDVYSRLNKKYFRHELVIRND